MADSGKQSPLGVNVLGSIIDNIGFWINPEAESYMGKSKLTWTEIPGSGADYARTSENLVFGKTVEESCLKWVTWSINDAFFRGAASKANVRAAGSGITVLAGTYNNIVNIGQNSTTGGKYLPALGNSPPFDNWTNQNADSWDPTYQWKNPHPEYVNWGLAGPPATASYGLFNWEKPVYEGPYPVSSPFTPVDRVNFAYMNEGQLASWWPFRATAPLTGGPGASTGAPGATGAPVGSGPGPNSYAGCTPGPVDVKWEPKFEEYTAPGENTQNPWRWVPGSDGASGEVYSIRIGPMSEWATPVPDGVGTGWTNPGTPMLFGGSFCARPGYPTPNNWEWCISECPGDFDNPISTTSVDPTRYPSRPAKGRFGGEYGSFKIAYGRGKFAQPWAGDGDPNKTYYFNFKFQPGTALFLDLMINYEWQMNWDGIPTLDPAATPTGGGTVSTSIVDSTTPGLPPPPAGTGEYILHKGAGLGTAAGTVTAEQNKIVAIQILSPNNRLAVQNEPPIFNNGFCETWVWQWIIPTLIGKAETARFNFSETPADMTNSAYNYPTSEPYTPGSVIPVSDTFPNYYLCWGPPADVSITTTPLNGKGPYTVLDPQKTYYLNVELSTPAAAQFYILNSSQGYLGGGTTWGSSPLPTDGIPPPPGVGDDVIPGPVNAEFTVESSSLSSSIASSVTPTVSTATDPVTGTGSAVPNRGITQWGWVRLIALQAWNEFNYNNELKIKGYNTQRYWIQEPLKNPEYRMFCDSFMSFYGFMQSTNEAIYSLYSAYTPEPTSSNTFLKGSYSNMDDLVTADIAGVTLAFRAFGQDLLNLGRIIDWQYVSGFGLPSGLLKSLYNNNALTSSLNLILLTAGLSQTRVNDISTGNESATKEEEQQMYGAFLVTVGEDLKEILATCNCSTAGLTSLGDCLNVKKLFPNSYTALTVPLYNTTQSAAQSAKTYYPLITPSTTNLNISLNNGAVRTVVGTLVPEGAPPIIESVQTAETATIAAAAGILESPFSINEVDLPSKTNTILTRIQQNLNRNGTTLGSAVQDDIQERLSQGIVAVKTATGIGSFIEQQLTSTTVSTNNLPSVPAPNPQPTIIPEATGSSAIVSGSSTGQTLAKTGGGTIAAQDKLNLDDK